MAAGCNAVGISFVDQTSTLPTLQLSTYTSSGVLSKTLQYGSSTVDFPDPAVAALPGDAFAIAWTDLGADGDELGIQLRLVDPNETEQRQAVVANAGTGFSQSAPDIVFDGNELVVAWMDNTDPATAPDLRYRLFAPDLTPLGEDVTLAQTSAVEGDVALAASNGQWAAAWRSDAAGLETIEVQSGTLHWSVGPFLPGISGDRPDLTFLDATHWALAFTMGTDPSGSGVANVSRLHGAILDAAAPGHVASFAIPPAQDPYAAFPMSDQSQPALTLFPDHLLVSWRSGAVPGDAKDSELWSRRIPFTVGADHSVIVDPTHVELPLVRVDAQRAGDQSAFRVLSTNLWPSGGLVAAWTDQGRSFHSAAGAPDVAVQFLPGLVEPPPPVTTYPVSADGKYYYVNLLRRNFLPPTVSATFANDAVQIGANAPPAAFDGDDGRFVWGAPVQPDLDAIVTLTVDMGQYYSIGAVRPLYTALLPAQAPLNHRIRLATTFGQWTEVVPMSPSPASDATLSFNATPARYVELTMVGNNAVGSVTLTELFVYPSTQSSPPPTSASGYDLAYLSSSTVNSNFFTPGTVWPVSWPAGAFYPKSVAQGATGDAVGIVDLGAQYSVSHLSLCFFHSPPWDHGGRLEIAAIPDTYTTVSDSGLGHQFGALQTPCEEFSVAPQPVRYIRSTNYFNPGFGLSPNVLWSVQAFTNPAPHVAYYPLGDDTKYFKVNLLRRPTSLTQPTATVAYANGAAPDANPSLQTPANVFDGDDRAFRWAAPGLASDPNPQVTLTIDLGQVLSIGAIHPVFNNPVPLSYSLRAAQTLGAWTQAIADAPIPAPEFTASFDATPARYLELTMKGTLAFGVVDFQELLVFPSATTDPAPTFASQNDLTYLTGATISVNANMVLQAYAQARIQQLFGRGKTVAQGATGDGVITVDLGQQYQVSQIGLAFYQFDTWPGGGKVEVDDGSGTLATVFDSGRGTTLGPPAGGLLAFPFSTRTVRYIRVTDYFVPGVGTSAGRLMNIEAF